MKYFFAKNKHFFEKLICFPIIILGKLFGKYVISIPAKNYYIFMPNADLGGANKVTIDIINILPAKDVLVFFSKKSKNSGFLPLMQEQQIEIIDLSKKIDNKYLYFINIFYRGVIANAINCSHANFTIGGEAIYFFKVIPYLKKYIRNIEISHVPTWRDYTQSFYKYLNKKICSTKKLMELYQLQIPKNEIPYRFNQKLLFVDNWINIPEKPHINEHSHLNVLFVGRGSPQKRIHLISSIAEKVYQKNLNIHFSFVGDVEFLLTNDVRKRSTCYGNITDKSELQNIYKMNDLLILTSKYEGLPIVVMEAMALGKMVLSTSVNSIPDYIVHNENGFLIYSEAENEIIDEGINYLIQILNNTSLRKTIGLNAYNTAKKLFSKAVFEEEYNKILNA